VDTKSPAEILMKAGGQLLVRGGVASRAPSNKDNKQSMCHWLGAVVSPAGGVRGCTAGRFLKHRGWRSVWRSGDPRARDRLSKGHGPWEDNRRETTDDECCGCCATAASGGGSQVEKGVGFQMCATPLDRADPHWRLEQGSLGLRGRSELSGSATMNTE